eukprot:PhM_4_TR9037/c0_g1_i1/m.48845
MRITAFTPRFCCVTVVYASMAFSSFTDCVGYTSAPDASKDTTGCSVACLCCTVVVDSTFGRKKPAMVTSRKKCCEVDHISPKPLLAPIVTTWPPVPTDFMNSLKTGPPEALTNRRTPPLDVVIFFTCCAPLIEYGTTSVAPFLFLTVFGSVAVSTTLSLRAAPIAAMAAARDDDPAETRTVSPATSFFDEALSSRYAAVYQMHPMLASSTEEAFDASTGVNAVARAVVCVPHVPDSKSDTQTVWPTGSAALTASAISGPWLSTTARPSMPAVLGSSGRTPRTMPLTMAASVRWMGAATILRPT